MRGCGATDFPPITRKANPMRWINTKPNRTLQLVLLLAPFVLLILAYALGSAARLAENPGAFLSLGSGLSDPVRFWILTVSVGLFIVGLLVYLFRNPALPQAEQHALAWIGAGGFSNFLDRAFRSQGKVALLRRTRNQRVRSPAVPEAV